MDSQKIELVEKFTEDVIKWNELEENMLMQR